MAAYSGDSFEVMYKITVQKSFFMSAPLDVDERVIIDKAVALFNSDDACHTIVPTDVVLVQYYDAEHDYF